MQYAHVLNEITLHWTVQGIENRPRGGANLPLSLKIYIKDKDKGIEIALDESEIPALVSLGNPFRPHEQNDTRIIVKEDGDELNFSFEGNGYFLLRVVEVFPESATIFFTYPPVEFGGGDIVFNPFQHFE